MLFRSYPICYNTCSEVFYITPPPPKPRVKKVDEEGNEVEEPDPEADMDPEELAKKYARKFQSHIYPDSFILLRG